MISGLKAKFRIAIIVVFTIIASVAISACGGIRSNDYVGSWMGLDDSRDKGRVYQFDILEDDMGGFTIRSTEYHYQLNVNNSSASWKSSAPQFFTGRLDEDGNLVSDIGVIKAKPSTFQLIYGNISMTRKAKNTELKLKYVIRDQIEKSYPGIIISD